MCSSSVTTRTNCCAAIGCSRTIERWMLLCPGHWAYLPEAMQLEVTRSYSQWVRGQALVGPYFIARLKALIAIGLRDGADVNALELQLKAREAEVTHER